MVDLIDTPIGKALAVRLFQRLLEIQQESGDPLDLRADFPQLSGPTDGEKTR